MLGESGTFAHHGGGFRLRHPRAMPLDHVLMLPAIDLPPPRFGGETAQAHRAWAAVGPGGDVAHVPLAACIPLKTLHWPQLGPCRAAVDVLLCNVGELVQGEASLFSQTIVLLGFRH